MSGNITKQTILAVDDTPTNIDVIKGVLSENYFIQAAISGKMAFKIIEKKKPDIILLDIMMPEMDGYEVCQLIKNDESLRDIPIIFLTAKAEVEDEAKGLAMGAVDYITKPISPPILKERVKNHLALKSAHKELKDQNRFIKETFGKYVSTDVVNYVINSPDGLKIGGEKRVVTILMSDLRGFTDICERLTAEAVVDIIGIYLEIMTEIIFKYEGTIGDIIGDSLLVIFGAPVQQSNDGMRAVACALEMQRSMKKINEICRSKSYPQIAQGIGIHTGQVIAGNIGSSKRIKYGVVGTNVNLTARIESYTIGGQILVSEETCNSCGTILKKDGPIQISPKGIVSPINVYDITGIEGEYNIVLLNDNESIFNELKNPISIKYNLIIEKQITDTNNTAKLIGLSVKEADIITDNHCNIFSNIKISIYDKNTKNITDDLYAKVIKKISDAPPTFRIVFTAVPPEAMVFIKEIAGL